MNSTSQQSSMSTTLSGNQSLDDTTSETSVVDNYDKIHTTGHQDLQEQDKVEVLVSKSFPEIVSFKVHFKPQLIVSPEIQT